MYSLFHWFIDVIGKQVNINIVISTSTYRTRLTLGKCATQLRGLCAGLSGGEPVIDHEYLAFADIRWGILQRERRTGVNSASQEAETGYNGSTVFF